MGENKAQCIHVSLYSGNTQLNPHTRRCVQYIFKFVKARITASFDWLMMDMSIINSIIPDWFITFNVINFFSNIISLVVFIHGNSQFGTFVNTYNFVLSGRGKAN